ncbi:hypothetical protein D9M69_607150 [compost metagenome]
MPNPFLASKSSRTTTVPSFLVCAAPPKVLKLTEDGNLALCLVLAWQSAMASFSESADCGPAGTSLDLLLPVMAAIAPAITTMPSNPMAFRCACLRRSAKLVEFFISSRVRFWSSIQRRFR